MHTITDIIEVRDNSIVVKVKHFKKGEPKTDWIEIANIKAIVRHETINQILATPDAQISTGNIK